MWSLIHWTLFYLFKVLKKNYRDMKHLSKIWSRGVKLFCFVIYVCYLQMGGTKNLKVGKKNKKTYPRWPRPESDASNESARPSLASEVQAFLAHSRAASLPRLQWFAPGYGQQNPTHHRANREKSRDGGRDAGEHEREYDMAYTWTPDRHTTKTSQLGKPYARVTHTCHR